MGVFFCFSFSFFFVVSRHRAGDDVGVALEVPRVLKEEKDEQEV